ncbi:MAG: TolC family protein [Myxococcales bacterium]
MRLALLAAALLAAPVAVAAPATAELPERFQAGSAGAPAETPWWLSFQASGLDRLVSTGLAENHDVAAAAERIASAEARADQARATLFPTVNFDVSANATPFSAIGFQFGGVTPTRPDLPDVLVRGSAMFNVRYQLDVWGRQLNALRATRMRAEVTREEREGFGLSLASQIAEAWFDLIASREQVAVVERQISTASSLLELLQLRFERGEARAPDVLQQKQQLAAAKSRLPGARVQEELARQRLSVLFGRAPPENLPPVPERLPAVPDAPITGTPADLVDNRPDLRAALARLEAARLQAASAGRVYFPTVGVSGQAGWQAFRSNELRSQAVWGAGADLSFNLFRGGADEALIREADAEARAAEQSVRQLSLQAIAEVESALERERASQAQLAAVREQLEAARRAFEEARHGYLQGLTGYVAVFTALNALEQAQLAEVQAARAVLSARVQLHQALGGPWTRGLLRNGGRS